MIDMGPIERAVEEAIARSASEPPAREPIEQVAAAQVAAAPIVASPIVASPVVASPVVVPPAVAQQAVVERAVVDAVLAQEPEAEQAMALEPDAQQQPGWAARLAVFDLETTGVDTETARIVTAFLGVLDEHGEVVEERSWIADPGVEIPEGATAIHGFTTERARAEGSPAFGVVAEIVAAIANLQRQGVPVAAYNAAYDFTVLHHEALRHGIAPIAEPAPVIDPLVMDKQVDRYRRGKRTLGVTCAHYGIELDGWHDASADAVAAGRLAQAMFALFPQLQVPAADLHASTADWAMRQAESFARYMQQRDPSFQADRGWPVREARGA